MRLGEYVLLRRIRSSPYRGKIPATETDKIGKLLADMGDYVSVELPSGVYRVDINSHWYDIRPANTSGPQDMSVDKIIESTPDFTRMGRYLEQRGPIMARDISSRGMIHPPVLARSLRCMYGCNRVYAHRILGLERITAYVVDEDEGWFKE